MHIKVCKLANRYIWCPNLAWHVLIVCWRGLGKWGPKLGPYLSLILSSLPPSPPTTAAPPPFLLYLHVALCPPSTLAMNKRGCMVPQITGPPWWRRTTPLTRLALSLLPSRTRAQGHTITVADEHWSSTHLHLPLPGVRAREPHLPLLSGPRTWGPRH